MNNFSIAVSLLYPSLELTAFYSFNDWSFYNPKTTPKKWNHSIRFIKPLSVQQRAGFSKLYPVINLLVFIHKLGFYLRKLCGDRREIESHEDDGHAKQTF